MILEPKDVCGEFRSQTITTLLLFLLIISKVLLSITLGGGYSILPSLLGPWLLHLERFSRIELLNLDIYLTSHLQ